MTKLKVTILLVALTFVCIITSSAAQAKRPYTALRGLTATRVSVSVSNDVKFQMKSIGAGDFNVVSELRQLVESKLKDVGISPNSSSDGPMLSVVVDIDMSNDEFTVTINYSDLVSLIRDPNSKFETVLWTKTAHPPTDDAAGLKSVVSTLMNQFDVERMAASRADKN